MSFLALIGSRIGRMVALAGGVLVAVLLIFLRGRAAGKAHARQAWDKATKKKTAEARDAADKSRQRWADAGNDDLDDELRKRGL